MGIYGTPPLAIWRWNGIDAYDDYTLSLARLGKAYDLFVDNTQYLYIGSDRRFDALIFWLNTGGGYNNLTWEFSIEGGWKEFLPIQPEEYRFSHFTQRRYSEEADPDDIIGTGTGTYSIPSVDYVRWDVSYPTFDKWRPVSFTDTTPHAVDPPSDEELYWVRISISDEMPRNTATLQALALRNFASISSATDVQHQLQFDDGFSEASLPSLYTVERYLRGAEDSLYRITGHSFRPEFIEEELINFKSYGMTLRNRPILDMLRLDVHNGSYWEPKVEGRTQDWHMEPELGMLYVATLFLDVVPPTLRRGYSERRNQGAFKKAVRVRYIYGHDASRDEFSTQLGRIVTKQACVDILINSDFANLIPNGLDRVNIESKIKDWREEIDEFKSRYAKLVMY